LFLATSPPSFDVLYNNGSVDIRGPGAATFPWTETALPDAGLATIP
jgi:hypothetical protein